MLNKNEIVIVNEIVKAFDNDVEVVATKESITIVDPIENEVFTSKLDFIEMLKEIVKGDMTCGIPEIKRQIAVNYIIELNDMKYNYLKSIVLEATEKVDLNGINKAIKMLDDFINLWTFDACSLKQSQNIKTYRDIIINCETVTELHEMLKDIYYMKQEENVKNNDYILSTIEEVEADKQLFKDECNKQSELYDPEIDSHLNRYKQLNRKFMYIA